MNEGLPVINKAGLGVLGAPVSRQRLLQIKWEKEGRCQICGKPAVTTGKSKRCQGHLDYKRKQQREYMRLRNGSDIPAGEPPVPGKGRPRQETLEPISNQT